MARRAKYRTMYKDMQVSRSQDAKERLFEVRQTDVVGLYLDQNKIKKIILYLGEMAEWLKAHAWKVCIR